MPIVNTAKHHGTVAYEPVIVEITFTWIAKPIIAIFHPGVGVRRESMEGGGTLETHHGRAWGENLKACIWTMYGGEYDGKPSAFWKSLDARVI